MGWEYAWQSRQELIAHLCDEPTGYKTLARKATSEDGKSLLWAVHEIGPDNKENAGLRFIVCYLLGYDRQSGLHGCKEIGETMGPSYYSCPLSFLEMVPEPEGEYAKPWRKSVRKYHAYMAEMARRSKTLKIGDTVKLRDGCTPSEVVITSLEPLCGRHDGVVYSLSKEYLALPTSIDLNNAALELRKQGKLAEAEPLLRQALAIEEQDRGATHPKIPHRLNNLCTVLILQGKLAEAKSLLARAWQLKYGRHDLTSTRLLFVRLAIALLEFQPVEVFVGQLKNLLALESLPDHAEVVKVWDITCFIESLRPKIPPDAGDFLTALVSAMNDRTNLADLDRFPEWRNQPPIPLDTPWPNEQAHHGTDGGNS